MMNDRIAELEARIAELENQLEGAEQRGALILEVIAERDRLKAAVDTAEDALRRYGFRRCDIPACNCGSWHLGLAALSGEVK